MSNPAEIARSIPVTGERSLVTILRAVAGALESHGPTVLARPCAIDGKQTGTTYGGMICLCLRHLEPGHGECKACAGMAGASNKHTCNQAEVEVEPVDDREPAVQQDPDYPEPIEATDLADMAREDARMAWDGAEWARWLRLPDGYAVDAELVVRLRKCLDKLVNGKATDGDWRKLVAKVAAIAIGLVTTRGEPLKWPCKGWSTNKLEAEFTLKLNDLLRAEAAARQEPQAPGDPSRAVSLHAAVLNQNPSDWPDQGDW